MKNYEKLNFLSLTNCCFNGDSFRFNFQVQSSSFVKKNLLNLSNLIQDTAARVDFLQQRGILHHFNYYFSWSWDDLVLPTSLLIPCQLEAKILLEIDRKEFTKTENNKSCFSCTDFLMGSAEKLASFMYAMADGSAGTIFLSSQLQFL